MQASRPVDVVPPLRPEAGLNEGVAGLGELAGDRFVLRC